MSTSWLNYDSNVDDEQDDNRRALAKIMSPVPAAQLVSPMQGVSNPPNGGVVNAISPSADYAQSSARPAAAQPQSAYQPQVANGQNYSIAPWNPDPNASLRPGGTNPQAQPGALTEAMSSMPNPQANVTGPMQPAQPAGQLQPASSKGGFWRGLGRVADVAGSIVDPALTARIPGSMLYNQRQVGIQQGQAKAQADIANTQSQTADRTATAQERAQKAALDIANANKADRFDPNAAKTVETGDGVFQLNPASGRYDIRIGSQKDKTPEGERPLGSTVPNLNKTLADRYQVLNPGKALPPQYTLPATATQKDYDRVDKAMEGVEKAQGTLNQQQQTNAMRLQAMAAAEAARTANGNAGLDRETARMAKPYEKANESASSQLDKIDDATNMIGGNAEAQALGIPKVLTALVGGQGTGVRITTPELNAIATARGWGGDFQGTLNSISGKGKLTSTQQQQLKQILADVKTRISQKRQIANDALDEINGAPDRDSVIGADKKARQRLTDLESGNNAASGNGSGQAVSLAKARQMAQFKGKSDAEITAAIKHYGHQVIP